MFWGQLGAEVVNNPEVQHPRTQWQFRHRGAIKDFVVDKPHRTASFRFWCPVLFTAESLMPPDSRG